MYHAGDDANNLAWDLIVHGLVNEVKCSRENADVCM